MSHTTDLLHDIRARYAERQAMRARIKALNHGDETTPEQDAEMLELWMELDKGWTDAAVGALLAEIGRLQAIERAAGRILRADSKTARQTAIEELAAHWKGDTDD